MIVIIFEKISKKIKSRLMMISPSYIFNYIDEFNYYEEIRNCRNR